MQRRACITRLATVAASALTLPGAVRAAAEPALPPGLRAAGQGTLRVFGFSIYRARLWVLPGFEPAQWAALPLALELEYLTSIRAEDIASRSLKEMRRVGEPKGEPNIEQAQRWQATLQALLPDVRSGDKLIGWHRPAQGALFLRGEQLLGEVAEPAFSRLFFGIWLSERTGAPELRQALLAPLLAAAPGPRA